MTPFASMFFCCFSRLSLVVFALFLSSTARAEVRRAGEWPPGERISLSAAGVTQTEAVRRLAEGAQWSLVAGDLGEKKLDLEVRDQPASDVLELILSDGSYVAERRGSLVSIRRVGEATSTPKPTPEPAPAPKPPAASITAKKGEDRFVSTEEHIGREEVVRDVIVWRGAVTIEGTVTGSVLVLGGTAQLLPGAYVREDIFGVASSIELENGVQVDGEVNSLFGSLQRGDRVEVRCPTCGDDAPQDVVTTFFSKFFEKLAGVSLLWIVGAILLATTARRVEQVRAELFARPLRSFGIGVGSVLALLLTLVTLAVTLVGIPLAVILALVSVLVSYLAFCVIPFALGDKLFQRFTPNPYLQLAGGCTVLFFLQLIPGVGDLLSVLAWLTALGAVVATRGAGLFPKRGAPVAGGTEASLL